jgi:uncharacterized protein (TIGR02284 family)
MGATWAGRARPARASPGVRFPLRGVADRDAPAGGDHPGPGPSAQETDTMDSTPPGGTSAGALDALNALLTGSRDGAQNYREAAEALRRTDIAAELTQFASASDRHAAELEAEIRRVGGDPDEGGKLAAKARRAVQQVVSAVTGHDDSATLMQVEAGLDQAERSYALALRESLGAETRALVRRQWDDMQRQHDRVAALLRQDPGRAAA